MGKVGLEHLLTVVIESDLGGCRTWVDYEYFTFHDFRTLLR